MHVITPKQENVIATAAAEMTGLASPSRGSEELSTWKVRMEPGTDAVEHVIDREQVWMVTAGAFAFVADGRTVLVAEGQAVVLPAKTVRSFRAGERPAEALVAMPVGGRASLVDSEESQPVPWAV